MKYLVILVSLITVMSCTFTSSKNEDILTVSILPQKAFIEEIAGNNFKIKVLVGPGQSPATYEPLPSQMLDLAKSSAYFRIGVPFENSFIDKLKKNYTNLRIIDFRKGISLRSFKDHYASHEVENNHLKEESHKHEQEHENEHEHGHEHYSKDPHIWLSPELVKIQAKTILDELIRLKPEKTNYFKDNYESFLKRLDELSQNLAKQFEENKVKQIMVFHPSWGYLLDQFGIEQLPIEVEGKSPTPKQLAKIIDYARNRQIKVIFVQKQFSTQSAEAIAKQIGAKVIQIDPLASDYFNNLKNIAHKLTKKVF